MKKKENKTIQCDVHECKYCDSDDDKCTLDEIKVSKCNEEEEKKEDTMCDSFEQENNNKEKNKD